MFAVATFYSLGMALPLSPQLTTHILSLISELLWLGTLLQEPISIKPQALLTVA